MNAGPQTEPILGIDLGTTFSLVAICDERGPRVLTDESGDARIPSVLLIEPGGAVQVGWQARNQAVEHPEATIYSVKRLMGRGAADLERDVAHLTYAVRPGPRGGVRVEIAGELHTPEQLSAQILRVLRHRAETQLRQPVRKAVITVPAYFDDAQRQATRDAGAAAGLEVLRIINEPTAAALAYGIGARASAQDQPSDAGQPETVAIFDLGGGTFDVSILRIEGGIFEVLATAGDTRLGGDDFDRALAELVLQNLPASAVGQAVSTPRARQALRMASEQTKILLSQAQQASLLLVTDDGQQHTREVSRTDFEAAIAPLVDRTITLFQQAVADAKLTMNDLDSVILVGGSTRVPLVRRRVAEAYGRAPYAGLNPDEVVALGAAVQGALLAGQPLGLLLLDVIPLSLGIETLGGAVGKLILRNSTIPCRATEQFSTFIDGQTAIKLTVLQGERELAADCRKLAEFELRGIPPMPAGIPKVEVEFLVDANGILNVSARELRSGVAAQVQVMPNYGLTRAEVEQMTLDAARQGPADVAAHRRIDLVNQVRFDTHKAEQMLVRVGGRLESAERERIERDIVQLRALAEREQNLDRLHAELDRFGKSTVRLAEIGIAAALRDE